MKISDELLRKLDVAGPRYTSYPTVPVWTESFDANAHAAALRRAGSDADAPLSLYVHIPFCHELCSYCGCNVIITRDRGRVERYLAALGDEAAMVAAQLGARRTLTRVHLGGGTPTFLDEEQLHYLWKTVTAPFRVAPGAEIAIEINPVGTRLTQLERLAGFGFNRLSIGVQDFDPRVQDAVNRHQTVEETRNTIDAARELGFKSINLDIIYGLPRQTVESFRATVREVIALAPERVAAFSFAYVPALKAHQKRLPVADMPSGRAKLDLFLAAREELAAAGYRAIGMDHFARPDDDLARAAADGRLGRDFQGYTVEKAPDTIALGMSSISQLGDAYAQNEKSMGAYEAAIASGRLPTERGMNLTADDVQRRNIIHALMCNFVVDLGDTRRYGAELTALEPLIADGLVEVDGSRVTVKPLGQLFVRNVAMVFDAHLSKEGARPFSRAV